MNQYNEDAAKKALDVLTKPKVPHDVEAATEQRSGAAPAPTDIEAEEVAKYKAGDCGHWPRGARTSVIERFILERFSEDVRHTLYPLWQLQDEITRNGVMSKIKQILSLKDLVAIIAAAPVAATVLLPCKVCQGRGLWSHSGGSYGEDTDETCKSCNGTGYETAPLPPPQSWKCTNCGQVKEPRCNYCGTRAPAALAGETRTISKDSSDSGTTALPYDRDAHGESLDKSSVDEGNKMAAGGCVRGDSSTEQNFAAGETRTEARKWRIQNEEKFMYYEEDTRRDELDVDEMLAAYKNYCSAAAASSIAQLMKALKPFAKDKQQTPIWDNGLLSVSTDDWERAKRVYEQCKKEGYEPR